MLALALSLRFVMLFASLGASVGAVLMFIEGGLKLRGAIAQMLASDDASKSVIAAVMGATDKFLFGIVLVIFAYAIAFGFVFQLAPETRRALPRWMRVDGIGELKHTFIEVILVYLAVDFVTDIAEADVHLSWESLVLPVAMVCLAGAMRLLATGHRPAAGDADDEDDPPGRSAVRTRPNVVL